MNCTSLKRLAAALLMLITVNALNVNLAQAEIKLPAIIGDHMVLQQGQKNPLWGWADPGEKITVTVNGQTHSATADDNGKWKVTLEPLKVGGPYEITIKGKETITLKDVLSGEVWICSGQSNMAWTVGSSNDADLEIMTANYPKIRLISVPQVGTQEPQDNFNGQWEACTPETVRNFSGVGYFFGRQLYQTLNVPIGLIDNAWGGSSAEAWVNRKRLEDEPAFKEMLEKWKQTEATYNHDQALAAYKKRMDQWKESVKKAKAAGKAAPQAPRAPRNPLTGNHRPSNIYNGVLYPTIGYGIKGVIWYQGESNANRAYQYRKLFPYMIQNWRDEWKQGDFPFYWVQLADFRSEKPEPADSDWAELREAQTMTMDALPNTGEAVILNLGEASDIHPKNKQDVAMRLARWALAKDYGVKVVHQSPRYKSMEVKGNKVILTFDHVGGGLDTFDVTTPIGFTIAGEDKKFVKANAKIVGSDKIEVWSDAVMKPAAVRYAWADNPICNVQNKEGLPVTPFRTDDWPGVTINNQ
ncbi:MAG: sialate O-acetylesterase [Planctomycetaceae bacterium]|nr:sialate O-acetylesterase [Planctomycetaceae bacterium]